MSTDCPVLPLEIVERILSNLEDDDANTLLSCSLVSQLWRQAALLFLFSYADLSSKDDVLHWHGIVKAMPNVPLFVRHVRYAPGTRLQWDGSPAGDTKRIGGKLEAESDEEDNVLEISLPAMPGAGFFDWITGEIFAVKFTPQISQLSSSLPNIRHLSWSGQFATANDAIDFLGLFTQLQTLELLNVRVQTTNKISSSFRGNMVNLRSLRLRDTRTNCDWLVIHILSVSPPDNLESIEYTPNDHLSLSSSALSALFSLAAPSLKKLCIQCVYLDLGLESGKLYTYLPMFHIPTLSVLQDLVFSVPDIIYSALFDVEYLEWCSRFLDSISDAPVLRVLTVPLPANGPQQLDTMLDSAHSQWQKLVDKLSRFSSLTKLVVLVSAEQPKGFGPKFRAQYERKIKDLLLDLEAAVKIGWTTPNSH